MSDAAQDDLARRCQEYLDKGPPQQMSDYVPGSFTEIIIAHGTQKRKLDAELRELGEIILGESRSFDSYKDVEIRDYMKRGAALVSEVLEQTA